VAACPDGSGMMGTWFLLLGVLLLGEDATNLRHPSFEKNKGQAPADIRYILRTPDYQLDFKRAEIVLHAGSSTMRIQFDGPLNKRVPEGHARLDGLIRYVDSEDAPPRAHASDHAIPKFASIRYDSLYKGIDLICYARGTSTECGFLVLSGGEPEQIRAFIDGGDMAIEDSGTLLIRLPDREIRFPKPNGFQVDHGQRKLVDVRYQLSNGNEIGFLIGEYDHSNPLTIDPH
jgi:hypothetical protein